MDAHPTASRRSATRPLFAALSLTLLVAGCTASPEPEDTAAELIERARADAAAEPSPPEPPPPPAPAERERPSEVVVIDPGAGGDGPKSLYEAARAERKRRSRAGEPVAVITDESLAGYAADGRLTVVDSGPEDEAEEDDQAATSLAGLPGAEEEGYWRDRARSLRRSWREAVDEIEELEGRVAELRRRFYAEDDPHFRDSRIKPAWDRALERLEEARRTADRARDGLTQLLEEGRRAGALPGWLREGIELEPEPLPEPEPDPRDPGEPVVVGEEGSR